MQYSKNRPWWQTAVIYQVYPRSFQDTNGNGIGDLQGIIQRLNYLADILGVDAIWLSPFYPSPMADFGYDVENYTEVHPLFGDLNTFNRLVQDAHVRGVRIIIDLVPNHTSDQHPWFLSSRSSKEDTKRDWYVWRDANPDGSTPNNWLSVFGGSAWEWDDVTGQYYLHSFLKEQPDLNWRNTEVKEAMFDVVRFWLDRGVDGFRIDVAHFIMKDPLMRDNPPNQSNHLFIHKPIGTYDQQIHLYDKGHEDVHQVYQELRSLLDTYTPDRDIVSIGEIHIFDLVDWVSYYGKNLDELHMPFNFLLLKVKWTAQEIRRCVEGIERAIPPGAWPNYVLGNHDESRIATRIGEAQTRIAAMLLLTLRGTPTLYYGDEIGMRDVPVPYENQQDPWGIRIPGLSRDPNRTPMQWGDESNAGFSPPNVKETWLPLDPEYTRINVKHQLKESQSLLNLYRELLSLRRQTPALHSGTYESVHCDPIDCFVFKRWKKDEPEILVTLNMTNQDKTIDISKSGQGVILLSTQLDRQGTIDLQSIQLRADEGLIIQVKQK